MKLRTSETILAGITALSAASLAAALAARAYLAERPEIVEGFFAPNGLYAALSSAYARLTGLLPFSICEMTLLLAAPALVLFFFIMIKRMRTRGTPLWRCWACAIAIPLSAALLLAASFVGGWGLSYLRMPYARIAGLDTTPASIEELAALCHALADEAAILRESLNEDENGVYALPYGVSDALGRVNTAYDTASANAPWLGGAYGAPKPVLLSDALCHTQITGIFIPFTMEANVNTRTPSFQLAATACHEAAHQRGFAREDEANFIAYYACVNSGNDHFRYSGLMLALTYAGNALAGADADAHSALRDTYSEGMLRDFAHSNAFWWQYEGAAHEVQSRVNDSYLKANGQEDGVRSYGRMVDLLVAQWREGVQ